MPAQVAGAVWDFRFGFLHTVLAEVREAGIGAGADDFGGEFFAHGHQLHLGRIAPGPVAGGGDVDGDSGK